jgi:hypothetical protein
MGTDGISFENRHTKETKATKGCGSGQMPQKAHGSGDPEAET